MAVDTRVRSHGESGMKTIETVASSKPAKKAVSLLEEFKEFAFKRNVIDLAVGVIIGAAFGKIIDSLVRHIVMPLISIAIPGQESYLGWKWVFDGKEVPYGLFLGEIVNFLIVALVLFIFIVKFLGWALHMKNAEAEEPTPLTKDQELLTEIRDLLKQMPATQKNRAAT
jgi:large conductance mechanosensitive channel